MGLYDSRCSEMDSRRGISAFLDVGGSRKLVYFWLAGEDYWKRFKEVLIEVWLEVEMANCIPCPQIAAGKFRDGYGFRPSW